MDCCFGVSIWEFLLLTLNQIESIDKINNESLNRKIQEKSRIFALNFFSNAIFTYKSVTIPFYTLFSSRFARLGRFFAAQLFDEFLGLQILRGFGHGPGFRFYAT